MTEPFPPAFRDTLLQVLRRAPELRAARDTEARARRRVMAQGGTFSGHRAYAEGDDPRYVDWNAYARTGELFVKVFEEEDRRTLTLCLDRSASMAVGEPERLRGALRVAAILGSLALTRLDGVRVVVGRGELRAFAGAASMPRLLEMLARLGIARQEPLELLRVPLERGWMGTVVWISDFADPEAAVPALRLLRQHGRRCWGWLPGVPDDALPTAGGWIRLVDPETGAEEVMEVDAAMRRAMAEELRRLALQQEAAFAAVGFPLVRFPLPAEGDFRVRSWLPPAWTSRI